MTIFTVFTPRGRSCERDVLGNVYVPANVNYNVYLYLWMYTISYGVNERGMPGELHIFVKIN